MIIFDRVSKRYPNGREALTNVTFEVHTGEMVFLTGSVRRRQKHRTEAHRTSRATNTRTVVVGGKNTSTLKARHVPAFDGHIGVVFQDHKLLADRPVFRQRCTAPRCSQHTVQRRDKRVRAALDQVGCWGKSACCPWAVVGEQQRVGIARAVVSKPPLLIADEPTGNLDPDLALEIIACSADFRMLA